jgi:pimeloyl-ACP methyl ester carboxylesterase
MSYFLTSDNVKIYYDQVGSGKPVILIHGWSCSHLHFNNQIKELSKSFKVIYYDLRGHGISEIPDYGLTMPRLANDLKELIEHLALKDVTLVGWSMGTSIIFDYISQFGCDNLHKLCLIDMTPKIITDDIWNYNSYGNFSCEDNFKKIVRMNEDWNKLVQYFVPAMFAKSGYTDEKLINWALNEMLKSSPNAMIRIWISMTSKNYLHILKKISIPTLITCGEESVLYPPENSEYMNKEIPESKLLSFPKCGHALFLEEPEMFNDELTKFIR